MLGEQFLIMFAGILDTAIGVSDKTFTGQFTLDGHLQSIVLSPVENGGASRGKARMKMAAHMRAVR